MEVQQAHPDRFAIVKPVDPDDPAVAECYRRLEEDAGRGRHPHHADEGGEPRAGRSGSRPDLPRGGAPRSPVLKTGRLSDTEQALLMAAPAPSLWVVAEDKLVFPSGSIGVTREHLRITGTPLVLAVRPEKLWFARHKGALSEADINRISAVVLDVTLIGEMYRYLLETEFGALLSLKQQHRYGAFTPGLFAPVIVEAVSMLSRGQEQRRRRAPPVGVGCMTVSFRPAIPWRIAPQLLWWRFHGGRVGCQRW